MENQRRGQIILDIMGDEPDQISLYEVDADGEPIPKTKSDDKKRSQMVPAPMLEIVPITEKT